MGLVRRGWLESCNKSSSWRCGLTGDARRPCEQYENANPSPRLDRVTIGGGQFLNTESRVVLTTAVRLPPVIFLP